MLTNQSIVINCSDYLKENFNQTLGQIDPYIDLA
jgi:hypothetical protein